MKEKTKKKTKKKNLPRLIIVLIFLIIIIGIILLIMTKNNKKENNIDPNGDLITVIDENNEQSMQFIDGDNKDESNKEKKYIELDYKTYYEGNKDNNTFRIQDVIHNKDGTITIKGRVYRYIELPSTLSASEYKALLDGKSLNILGEKVTKIQDDGKAKEAGYEAALKIENKKYSYEMIYYMNSNEDGTANLYNGVDASIAEGTDIYLEKTLDANFECVLNDKTMPLKDYYKKDVHIANKDKTRLLYENDTFVIDYEYNDFIRLVLSGF